MVQKRKACFAQEMARIAVLGLTVSVILVPSSLADFKYKGPKNIVWDSSEAFGAEQVDASAFAQQVPLSLALSGLSGDATKFRFGADVDQGVLVDWRGGRTRHEILQEMLTPIGLRYRYDTGLLHVFSEREVATAQRIGVALVDGVPSEQVIWPIEAPITVKRLFEQWTQSAGRTLVWNLNNSRDCTIRVSHTIEGSLETAIKTIVDQSNKEGRCSIPYGRTTANNAVLIDELYRGQR